MIKIDKNCLSHVKDIHRKMVFSRMNILYKKHKNNKTVVEEILFINGKMRNEIVESLLFKSKDFWFGKGNRFYALISDCESLKSLDLTVEGKTGDEAKVLIRRNNLKKWKGKCMDFDYFINGNHVKYENLFDESDNFTTVSKTKETLKQIISISRIHDDIVFRNRIKEYFSYDDFRDKDYPATLNDNEIKWNRNRFLYEMGIEVCPYCNRQYISNIADIEDRKLLRATADLDHFYHQGNFPYLALSFMNFIPCCSVCNRTFKGTHNSLEEKILYPYDEGFGNEIEFVIDSSSISSLKALMLNKGNVKLDINYKGDPDFNERAEKSVKLFRLMKLYQAHPDIIKEIIVREKHINAAWGKEMMKMSARISGDKKLIKVLSENEMKNFILGTRNEDDWGTKPFSKFTSDILRQLRGMNDATIHIHK